MEKNHEQKVSVSLPREMIDALQPVADLYHVGVETVVANMVAQVIGEFAALNEYVGDKGQVSLLAMSVVDENGTLLSGDSLVGAVKAIKLQDLREQARLRELAGDTVFERIPCSGSA